MKFLNRILRCALVIALSVFSLTTASAAEVHIAFEPNDPDFVQQRYLSRIRVPQAWDLVQTHRQLRDVVIAVLDTGVDIDHPDLEANMWVNQDEIPDDGIDNDNNSYIDDAYGWDFTNSTPDPRPKFDADNVAFEAAHHGTVVSGIMAAEINNQLGIAGIGYGAKIMPLRVLDSSGSGSTLLLAQAIDYAVENGADIINLSLVGNTRDPNLVQSIASANQAGVAIVAASGNQEEVGVDLDVEPRYPVCDEPGLNRVFGVAAVDEYNRLTNFSNYGESCIDVSAPGTGFYSTMWYVEDNPDYAERYGFGWSGTSVAAPLVSATLALIRQVAPNLSVDEMYRAVSSGAKSAQLSNANFEDLGAGLLDTRAAIEKALELSRFEPLRIVMGEGPGGRPLVSVRDTNGLVVNEFYAYAEAFRGGVRVAVGDIDGDNASEIVTVPASQGGPHVRIFNLQGELEGQFMAYNPAFRGGLTVSIGDVNGDGIEDIITGPNAGGGPHVRSFNAKGELLGQFMAYDPNFLGGVLVEVGDIDSDGIADIVTVPASQGGPHVRIFDTKGEVKGQFMAFDPEYRGGLSLGIGNIDNLRGAEIVVAQTVSSNVIVKIFNSLAVELNRFAAYPNIIDRERALSVDVHDYTGDGLLDIVAYTTEGNAEVRLYDYFGTLLNTTLLESQTDAQHPLSIDYTR